MVDGKTINELRQDLDSIRAELQSLAREVGALKEKAKLIESLDAETFGRFIQFLAQNSQGKSTKF